MPEFNKNLWAPWRMQYIRSLGEDPGDGGCFLCRDWEHPESDKENHVVWRGRSAFVVMNRFPYTNGHLLVASARHEGEMTGLSSDELAEITTLIRDSTELLCEAVNAQGFNIGYNLGLCAGAGLPGHLHAHIVPRWAGDTNYMAVLGDARVVPDALDSLYDVLTAAAVARGWRT